MKEQPIMGNEQLEDALERIAQLQAALIKIRDARGIFETNGLRRIARDALLKGGKRED